MVFGVNYDALTEKPVTLERMRRAFYCYLYWREENETAWLNSTRAATSIPEKDIYRKRAHECERRLMVAYRYITVVRWNVNYS